MKQIIIWKPVRTFTHESDIASAVFEPGLNDITLIERCSPHQRCIIRGTDVYDGIHKCTLDRITAPYTNCVWLDPTVPTYFVATICSEWSGRPPSRGTIEIL